MAFLSFSMTPSPKGILKAGFSTNKVYRPTPASLTESEVKGGAVISYGASSAGHTSAYITIPIILGNADNAIENFVVATTLSIVNMYGN